MILVQNHQQRLNGSKNSIEYIVLSIELRKERKRNIELSPNLLGLVSHLSIWEYLVDTHLVGKTVVVIQG